MGSTNLLLVIKQTYPEIRFEQSDEFRWSPPDRTVYVGPLETERDYITLYHEIGHALAAHSSYNQDIELLQLEREAWSVARSRIAPRFDHAITDELIEEALDSYRSWLHARSLCPECDQNGIQKSPDTYACLLCESTWRVNDARRCGLRRYLLQNKTSR